MKKIIAIPILLLALYGCESHTYEELLDPAETEGPVTYNGHIKAIIDNNCIMCHSPGGVSSFRPLTTYTEVRDAVLNTNLLDRIQRQNGEDGQMPKTGRMPQDRIDLILQWNADGLPED